MAEGLAELEALLATLGYQTKARVIQKRQRLVARSQIGEGKLAEIKQQVTQLGIQLVVFDRELSPSQSRELEKVLGCQVMDRTGIILEIFHENARTPQAKTQVEIARLQYLLPRLTGAWSHFQRQKGGGVNSKGMGETQIEIDRRRARDRIHRLNKELEEIRKDKMIQAKSRQGEWKVALVGYTNSGKTSLMNALTKSGFEAKDQLFATLDASVRVIDPRTRPKILLSDTVGFIRQLPHSLVESFKSTLDHVLDADLLLHVVDVAGGRVHEHIETTMSVLHEIGAGAVPCMIVFNKVDRLDDPFYPRILKQKYRSSFAVSSFDANSVMLLRDQIYRFFEQSMEKVTLHVPHDAGETIAMIHSQCKLVKSDYSSQDYVVFEVAAPKPMVAKLSTFVQNMSSEESTYELIATGHQP